MNSKGKRVARRVHGRDLQSRWDGNGLPPLLESPPQAGLPALEPSQPYHYKMNPVIILGPRCNHDLGILLRLPVLPPMLRAALERVLAAVRTSAVPTAPGADLSEDSKLRAAWEASVEAMVEVMIDHEYYASDYSSKDQPHAANLLQTLHDSLIRHDRYAAEREATGKSNEGMDRARRLLQSLVTATTR